MPVPIVMCTALTAGHKGLDACKDKGATDHLLKPYDRDSMIKMIQKYCGEKVGAEHACVHAICLMHHAVSPPMCAQANLSAASKPAPPGASAVEATAPPPAAAVASGASAGDSSTLEEFLKREDLEYCGKVRPQSCLESRVSIADCLASLAFPETQCSGLHAAIPEDGGRRRPAESWNSNQVTAG